MVLAIEPVQAGWSDLQFGIAVRYSDERLAVLIVKALQQTIRLLKD